MKEERCRLVEVIQIRCQGCQENSQEGCEASERGKRQRDILQVKPKKFQIPTKVSEGAMLQAQSKNFQVPTEFGMKISVWTCNFSNWTCNTIPKQIFIGTRNFSGLTCTLYEGMLACQIVSRNYVLMGLVIQEKEVGTKTESDGWVVTGF